MSPPEGEGEDQRTSLIGKREKTDATASVKKKVKTVTSSNKRTERGKKGKKGDILFERGKTLEYSTKSKRQEKKKGGKTPVGRETREKKEENRKKES